MLRSRRRPGRREAVRGAGLSRDGDVGDEEEPLSAQSQFLSRSDGNREHRGRLGLLCQHPIRVQLFALLPTRIRLLNSSSK